MPTQFQTVEKWLEYTLSDLRENLRKLKINDTGHLLASVEGHLVAAAGGDVTKLTIAYAAYGKFVDMGVGRGMGAGIRKRDSDYARIRDARGRLRQYSRKPRPFASKVIGKQSFRLSVLLSDYFGETITANIQNALPAQVTINL
jgi:hypothetical protein